MTSAQVVETSVKVTSNSPSQDYTHPDDHNLLTYDTKHIVIQGNEVIRTTVLLLVSKVSSINNTFPFFENEDFQKRVFKRLNAQRVRIFIRFYEVWSDCNFG